MNASQYECHFAPVVVFVGGAVADVTASPGSKPGRVYHCPPFADVMQRAGDPVRLVDCSRCQSGIHVHVGGATIKMFCTGCLP